MLALKQASDRTRPAFLDAIFLRNKRRAAAVQAGAVQSQLWYPKADDWLRGTTDREDAAGQVRLESLSRGRAASCPVHQQPQCLPSTGRGS